MDEQRWLEHLEGVVPRRGFGNRMSMYLIALEAWRRGLQVQFFHLDNPDNKMFVRYTISDGVKEYKFDSSQGDKLTNSAYNICENKDLTKSVLSKVGIPVPEGKRFLPQTNKQDALDYASEIKFPVVVKPVSENAGKGVFPNILTIGELEEVLDHVRMDLGYEDIIIEKHFHGTEYRILIVNDEIVGAVNRIPANIVGDGYSTIDELIGHKNESKVNNPIISTKTIDKDKEVLDSISRHGYRLDSIPPKDELIYLRNKSNVSRGGDPVDVTDQLTDQMRDLALRSVQAIEGLDICGLDMLVNEEDDTCVVLEINTKPMIGLHIYPIEGKARDVVSPIVDYYFPATTDYERSNLYFDFELALSPIRNYVTNELHLKKVEKVKKLPAKRFIIKGENLNGDFRGTIRFEALKLKLNGTIREQEESRKVTIMIAAEDKECLTSFEDFIKSQITAYGITDIRSSDWEGSINQGFTISTIPESRIIIQDLRNEEAKLRDNIERKERQLKRKEEELKNNEDKTNKLISTMRKKDNTIIRLDADARKLRDKIKDLHDEMSKLYNSRSWKVTQPLRSFAAKKNRNKKEL